MKMTRSSFSVVFCLLGMASLASASSPFFVWSSNDLDIQVTPILGRAFKNEFFKTEVAAKIQNAKPGTNVVVFVQPDLIFPDIFSLPSVRSALTSATSFGISLDAVQDPLAALEGAFPEMRVIDVDGLENALKSAIPDRVRVWKILLDKDPELDRDAALAVNQVRISSALATLKQSEHPFVAVLSGDEDAGHEAQRHVINKRSVNQASTDDPGNNTEKGAPIVVNSECVKVYFKALKINVHDGAQLKASIAVNKVVNESTHADCGSVTEEAAEQSLQFDVEGQNGKATLNMTMKMSGGEWVLAELHVKGNASKIDFDNSVTVPKNIGASKRFSYHCSALKIFEGTNATQATYTGRVDPGEFQIQAFMGTKGTGPFGPAFDCVGFFSIPIFTGLIFTLLLISAVTFGVILMANINTPDKYDDPKGQTITVPHE